MRNAGHRSGIGIAAVAALCLVTAACGYRPLYGAPTGDPAKASLTADLSKVQIMPIADRRGQLLYNYLKDNMHPRGAAAAPSHRLMIKLTEQKQDLGIRSDATATRANLILLAQVQLADVSSGRTVFEVREQTIASYDILIDNRYSTTISERRARRTGLDTLGEQIVTRVALFMNRRRAVQAAPQKPAK